MTLKFRRFELPVAEAMINTSSRIKPRRDGRHPYEKYFLLWTAFDNIYTIIAQHHGFKIELILKEDGSVETWTNGSVQIPKVKTISEKERISLALAEFDEELKHNLIRHDSTHFFANRIPFWQGVPIEFDALGQRLNGVLNVNYTTSVEYPVWSPLDTQVYQRYLANPESGEDRDFLTRQIADLLHTVRENLMHTSRKLDDANDISVIEHALPLLELVVGSFIR